MASTGPAVVTSTTAVTSTTTVTGQGDYSIVRCLISTDDVSAATPTWTDWTAKMREYDVQRKLDLDTGTAVVALDNRARDFDPIANPLIRPRNLVWLYEEFSGEVHDLFKGYAESWEQAYDKAGVDAVATVNAADEFKRLNLQGLPTTDPPRSSYEEVVAFDNPVGFWRMNDEIVATQTQSPSEVPPDAVPPGEDGDAPIPQTYNPFLRKAIYRNPNQPRRAYPKK